MIKTALIKDITPNVSVIVVTYNRVDLLSKTIDSILGQTYVDFELIIVDNMSSDSTDKYVSDLKDLRLRYFRNPNYGVIAVNRNYGIQKARGNFIAFCDDDDIWFPDKLSMQIKLMKHYPNVGLCYSNAESFNGETVIKKKMIRQTIRHNHFFYLLRGNYIPNSSVLIRADIFKTIGLLTIDPTLREDYEMWLRIARCYPLIGLDASLIRYRIHPNNVAKNLALETLRSIRTLKSITNFHGISSLLVWFNVLFQFSKYFYYKIVVK